MRNFVFGVLEKQSQYSVDGHVFNIALSRPEKEPRLYLTSQAKFDTDTPIFESPDYSHFVIEDIHVTVLPSHESRTMSSRKSKFKNTNPFHITLRLQSPDSEDTIIIHDFYSALDNARDFHIQLHQNASITYLPQKIIHSQHLDRVIKKEIRLVQELIETNQSHEQELFACVETSTQALYTLATQAYNFPEIMGPEDYERFLMLLRTNICKLEELISLGHVHEALKLQNTKLELEHWSAISQEKLTAIVAPTEETQPHADKTPSKKENSSHKNKSKSKAKASAKTKISRQEQTQYLKLLEHYFKTNQAFEIQKERFLKHAETLIASRDTFEPAAFMAHCLAHRSLLSELSFTDAEALTLKFFGQFSICATPEKQAICHDIALCLYEHLPHFSKHMRSLSLTTYNLMGHRISPILMAFLNDNAFFWEFMHSYGISFSDNRHILYDGIAGNLLQGMLILLRLDPLKFSPQLNRFVERLFAYLDEDQCTLSNMRTIAKLFTAERKKISATSFFAKDLPSDAKIERFKASIFEEPYGTMVIMDSIETWLIKARGNFCFGARPSEREQILMPQLVELMMTLGNRVDTKVILKAFERLLILQPIGMFDDYSCLKLLSKSPEEPLALLSNFELVYVGGAFTTSINQLLTFFMLTISQRSTSMSKHMFTTLMQSYFAASVAQTTTSYSSLFKVMASISALGDDPQIKSLLESNQQLTLARIAYLLFCIKVERKLNLTFADYQVMLHFYHCYLTSEISRFTKDTPEYQQQRNVCLNLMEGLTRAIEQLPIPLELKTEIVQSREYTAIMSLERMLKKEPVEPKGMKLGGL